MTETTTAKERRDAYLKKRADENANEYQVYDTLGRIVTITVNPHIVAITLTNDEDPCPECFSVLVNGTRFSGEAWLDMYNDFKPWLRDEPLEPAAEGSDGPDGDDGTAEAVASADKTYTGTSVHCCLMMDKMLDEGYLHPTMTWTGKHYPPHIAGPRLTPTGRKCKPNMLVNFCPWCGANLNKDGQ